jgi:putative ABC transport system permease protein
LNCLATGILPDREQELLSLGTMTDRDREAIGSEILMAGSHLTNSQHPSVVLGNTLSHALKAHVGDTVTLLTTTTTGMINAVDVEVVGIVRTSAKEYDRVFARVPLAVAQTLLNTKCVEKAVVLLEKTEDIERVAIALRHRFTAEGLSLELKTWDELADFYSAVVRMYAGIFGVIKALVVVLFLFGIANTMTMSVFERVREIGTLRAIGTKKWGIMRLFLWEGFLIGLTGGTLGIIVGIVTAKVINACGGFYIPPPPGMSRGYQALIFIEPQVLLYAFVSTVIVATLSALYPAWKATTLKIVEALGFA